VLDTPDDMINLMKVFKFLANVRHLKSAHTLQKIYSHAKDAEVSANPVQDRIASLWNTLLVRGLGIIPIHDATHAVDQQVSKVFEILRVSLAHTITHHE
jgi:hypothetical protein